MGKDGKTMPGRNGGTLQVGGNIGNAGGRPRKLPELTEIMANVLGDEKNGITATEAIIMAHRSKAAKGDIRSTEFLFKYGYGLPTQPVDLTSGGKEIGAPWFDNLPIEDKIKVLEIYNKAKEAGAKSEQSD